MLEPIVEANTWGPIIQAVPNIVFVIAVVLVYLLAMLKGYSHTKFEDVAISISQVLSCRSVFQYLSGFAICLLTSSSAFTLFFMLLFALLERTAALSSEEWHSAKQR